MKLLHLRLTQLALTAFFLFTLVSWSAAQQEVTIDFGAVVGDQTAACGVMYEGVGAESSTIELQDLRFYVSDLRLVNAAGEEVGLELSQDTQWQHQNVVLLDFEDGTARCSESGNEATNSSVIGTVPTGDYVGLVFTLGVPFDLNHADVATAPAPLNVSSMWWSWQNGYKHARIDLLSHSAMKMEQTGANTDTDQAEIDTGGASGGEGEHGGHGGHGAAVAGLYPIHIGSTGCASDASVIAPETACANPNLIEVRLDVFNVETDAVIADVASLLNGVDVSQSLEIAPPGCMSGADDPDCTTLFANLSLDPTSTAQTLFHSEAKPEQ